MDFKIDTKTTYTNIALPQGRLDAIMTEAIRQKWHELIENGCQNLIVDLSNCTDADENGVAGLLELHEENYNNGRSFMIIGVNNVVAQQLKDAAMLNIVPTLIEAVDMINMEILERELFGEE